MYLKVKELKSPKTNNKNSFIQSPKRMVTTLLLLLSSNVFVAAAQDLSSGTELKDSPLSLSLSTTALIPRGDQAQQLVISQYGILNKTTINQSANAGNSIVIQQQGINNEANLIQLGYGNSINVDQTGDNNLAEVIQEGDANIANIKQQGQQTFVVHQIGNDMVVNITQY